MAKYDTENLVLTERYKSALNELMAAELEMMREHEPDMADCWEWGVCHVGDLARKDGLEFTYGGNEDKPAQYKNETEVFEL